MATLASTSGAIYRAGMEKTRGIGTEDLTAYECVLRAYEYLHIHTADSHLRARDCLEQAIVIDPNYVDAWGWLAFLYMDEHRHGWNSRPAMYDALERALETGRKGVELDPRNQIAHGGLALVHFERRERDMALVEAKQALVLNPNSAVWTGYLGTFIALAGNWEEGVPLVKKAKALDPYTPGSFQIVFFLDHFRKGEYEKALAQTQKMDPRFYRRSEAMAMAYGQLGRKEIGRASCRERV